MSGKLPNGWATVPLGEIAEINPRHRKGPKDSMPVSFVPMAGLSECNPGFRVMEERQLGEVRKGFTHFAEGDVLFAKITPCMENGKGAVAVGLRNGIGCGTTELHVIRPRGGISPYYLYYFLSQPSIRQRAKESFTGSAGQARVPKSFIEQLTIPLPPIAEQRRIVAKLETLSAKVDACQHQLMKIPLFLGRFRQSILAAAYSGRLTADWRKATHEEHKKSAPLSQFKGDGEIEEELPRGWAWARIAEITETVPNIKPENFPNKEFGYVDISCIDNSNFVISDVKRFKGKDAPSRARRPIRTNDVIFSNVRTYLRNIALVGPGCSGEICSTGFTVLRPTATIEASYLFNYLLSNEFIDRVTPQQIGTHYPATSDRVVMSERIPLAPLLEQQEIVHRIEVLLTQANQIEGRYAKAQRMVDKISQSLLVKAFRGELVPTEAQV